MALKQRHLVLVHLLFILIDMLYETNGGIKSVGVWLTPEGGIASKFINGTGAILKHGSAVSHSTSADRTVILTAVEFDCIGFVYGDIAIGAEGWVVTNGVAEALFKNGTQPLRGYWTKASATTGRVEATTPPSGTSAIAANEHFKEVGHCLQTKTAGTDVVALIVVHPL